jgi:hypothetical protein
VNAGTEFHAGDLTLSMGCKRRLLVRVALPLCIRNLFGAFDLPNAIVESTKNRSKSTQFPAGVTGHSICN